jgi:hypothetical protein
MSCKNIYKLLKKIIISTLLELRTKALRFSGRIVNRLTETNILKYLYHISCLRFVYISKGLKYKIKISLIIY